MQATEELEVQGGALAVPWWEAPPFQGADFAGVLSAAAASKVHRDSLGHVRAEEVDEAEEMPPITYESALRAQSAWIPAVGLDLGVHSDVAGSETSDSAPAALQEPVSSRPRRSASVTIRLGEEENAQLKQRAAEAGLTISAYLRSCLLEVEALRTQVKQVLAELRMASEQKPSDELPRSWWQRMARTKSWIAQA